MNNLTTIETEVKNCIKCILSKTRTNAVPGDGPQSADLMFIGEAPGFHEDQKGKPFVGKAGQLLNKILGEHDIQRSSVYITNIVKCRPPNNRNPELEEINDCQPYLLKQINIINPKIIIPLGNFSLKYFFPESSITKVRGQLLNKNDRQIFPMIHPAAILRKQEYFEQFRKDVSTLKNILEENKPETPPKQMPLFN